MTAFDKISPLHRPPVQLKGMADDKSVKAIKSFMIFRNSYQLYNQRRRSIITSAVHRSSSCKESLHAFAPEIIHSY